MGINRKAVFLVCAASLALCGCDKIMGGGSAVVVTPSGAATQGLAVVPPQAPAAPSGVQTIDFGDDASKYSRDGECDDMRFGGDGMTDTPLLNSDIRHDASDCRSAFNQGRLTYKGENVSAPSTSTGYAESGVNHIIWGDDSSKYSKDGECDDKRFQGAGMTDTPLLDSDVKHDATDCRSAYEQGRLQLKQ